MQICLDFLKKTGMLGYKLTKTPMDSYVKLGNKDDSALVDKGMYQRLIIKLIYLSHTKPDIGLPISVVGQFMSSPMEKHMEAIYKILRYLKMIPGKGLFSRKKTRTGRLKCLLMLSRQV